MRSAADDNFEIPPIRTLRRVVPIARTDTRSGLALTFLVLHGYADSLDLECRLVTSGGHPARDLALAISRAGQARAQSLLEARRGKSQPIAPMVMETDPERAPRTLRAEPVISTQDDRSNHYHLQRWGSGGFGTGEFKLDFTFAPAIHPEARELWIEVARIDWTTFPPTMEERPPVRSDLGPWIIRVDLTKGLDVVQTEEVISP